MKVTRELYCDQSSEGMESPPLAGSAIALAEFQKQMDLLHQWAQHGCTNHGCRIEPPTGMGTNASCRCTPKAFAEALLWLACELDKYGRHGNWQNAEALPQAERKESDEN